MAWQQYSLSLFPCYRSLSLFGLIGRNGHTLASACLSPRFGWSQSPQHKNTRFGSNPASHSLSISDKTLSIGEGTRTFLSLSLKSYRYVLNTFLFLSHISRESRLRCWLGFGFIYSLPSLPRYSAIILCILFLLTRMWRTFARPSPSSDAGPAPKAATHKHNQPRPNLMGLTEKCTHNLFVQLVIGVGEGRRAGGRQGHRLVYPLSLPPKPPSAYYMAMV